MRVFVAVGGVLFGAVFVAHLLRLWAEGPGLLKEPVFVLTSVAALAAAGWALVLLLRGPRRPSSTGRSDEGDVG